MKNFLIIGGGQAGYSVTSGLRKRNPNVKITLIGEENSLPYQRPPLSKKYLLGTIDADRLLIRAQDWYAENAIHVICGQTITHIDRARQTAHASDGTVYPYDKLALTTGSRARTLPDSLCGRAENLFTLRGISDIARLSPLMQAGKKLCVIGGGYIGLEAAAVARQMGLEVTVIEAAPRILARVAAPETAEYFCAHHQQHGVQIFADTSLKKVVITDHQATAVIAGDREIPCDIVLAGIGILPNSELAEQAGLKVAQGIVVDEYARTTDPNIFAAGDCASLPFAGQHLRLESVQNATDQGDCVAANMLGENVPYRPKPWFWSDQYDIRLQIAGLNLGYDQVVKRTGKREGGLSVWYYKDGVLLAVDAMNDTLAYGIGKKVLDAGNSIPPEVIADVNANLKGYL